MILRKSESIDMREELKSFNAKYCKVRIGILKYVDR